MRLLNEAQELYYAKAQIEAISKIQAALLEFQFDDNISLGAFSSQILFCHLKDAFTDKLPRNSISGFAGQGEIEEEISIQNERVQKTRTLAIKRNKIDLFRLGISQNTCVEQLEILTQKRAGEFPGYGYNDLDYLALKNISRNEGLSIIALLKDGMITNAKRASGDAVELAYTNPTQRRHSRQSKKINPRPGYKEYLNKQAEVDDPIQWLSNLFDVASMEGSLCISFIYHLAQYMDQNRIESLPEEKIQNLCAIYQIGEWPFHVQSRFLALRNFLIPFVCESSQDYINEYFQKLLLLHWSVRQFVKNNVSLSDAIEHIPKEQLVAHFKKAYNLFEFSCLPKDFSPRFIKKLRAAAKIIIDPAVYPQKEEKNVPSSE